MRTIGIRHIDTWDDIHYINIPEDLDIIACYEEYITWIKTRDTKSKWLGFGDWLIEYKEAKELEVEIIDIPLS